jgi:preprotein translocase subunit YajC
VVPEEIKVEEKGGSTGLLIASILLMVAICGLFAYLVYRERDKKERNRGAKRNASQESQPAI